MEKIHFRAVWSPQEGLFKLTFRHLTGKNNFPACWDIKNDDFLKMIEHAESSLIVKEGQNKIGRNDFGVEFVDKLGNDCEIRLSSTSRDTFRQLTEYLRKVYDSWHIWKSQVNKN